MQSGTIYNMETGEISRVVYAPSKQDIELQCDTDETVIFSVVDGQQSYIQNGQITARPQMPAIQVSSTKVNVGEAVVITSLPENCQVYGPGLNGQLEDTELTWISQVPGTFNIDVMHFPDRPETITVEVCNV